MTRTADAAASIFYGAAARDCACGCDGRGVQVDGAKVYDATIKSLDASWNESKHPRQGGKFAKASEHIKSAVKAVSNGPHAGSEHAQKALNHLHGKLMEHHAAIHEAIKAVSSGPHVGSAHAREAINHLHSML